MIYSQKIKALIQLGDLSSAEESLNIAHDLARNEIMVPYFLSFYLTANLLYETRRMEEAAHDGDHKKTSFYWRKVRKTGRKAVKNSSKAVFESIETYRIIGISYWIHNKQSKALQCWNKAFFTAKRLGAKVEWAATLKEVSTRLSEMGSRYVELNGISPASMKEQAEIMYNEMGIVNR